MQFDFNVGPNQSQHIDVVGTFVKYKGGAGTIRVRLNGGGYIDLLPGQGVNGVSFTSIDIQDRTGAQNVGTILAGIYDFRDDRITGTVDVVDGGKARTLANMAFVAGVGLVGQGGLYSTAQLWNPAGSGKNIVVEVFEMTSPEGGYIAWEFTSAPLATFVDNGRSKKPAGAPSASQTRRESKGAAVNGSIGVFITAGNNLIQKRYIEPIVLPPGYGLNVGHTAANSGLTVYFEYFEEAA